MPTKQRSDWGSIRKIKKGVYEIRYTVNGKPKSTTFHGTRKEAFREKARLRLKYEDYKDCEMPIGAFWERVFLPECETRVANDNMSPTTLSGYKKIYDCNIRPEFEETPLNALKAPDVQRWLYTMTEGAAKHAKALLKIMMRRAEDLDYIEYHPMNKRYFLPTATTGKGRSKAKLSVSEIENVSKLIQGEWFEGAFLFAGFGGGQRSEVLGIKPDEVETIERKEGLFVAVPVNQTVHLIDGELIISNRAKNKTRAGYIIVTPPHSYRLAKVISETIKRGDKWLLDNGFGYPVTPNVLSKAWEKFLKVNGLKHVPFGNLRNSFSTNMHTQGLEDSTVSKLMRHANLTTDYTHYNNPSVDDLIDRLISAN